MRNLLILTLTLCISVICIGQKNNSNLCNATLTLDEIREIKEIQHYIYTGADTTGLNVKVTKIKIMEAKREMVKRRIKDCTSPNQADCYTQSLEEIPAVTMNMYTLPGPDLTTEYEIRKEKVEVISRPASQPQTPIVCAKNRTKTLITKVQNALVKQGYPLSINGILDQATMLSVKDFQIQNKLAYGDLTLEVLTALDIK
jgi:hypothetical protein